jgi:DNA-binding response OmpR family regulator
MSVLLVEDDARLARFTAEYLTQHQVTVTHFTDGEAALQEALAHRYDVIILDVMLPGRDGLSMCRALRDRSDVPIVLVTARGEEADRVLGLELGADDYVAKPFSPRELLARIRAVVRRDRGEAGPKSKDLTVGPLSISTRNRAVTLRGQPIALSTSEFDLLLALAQHPGRVLSREQLLRIARGSDSDTFDRAVDVQISRVRQKLGDDGTALIRTVRGLGYMLADG